MKARRGFTLIELLVVIAIIAILAAILFPVFAKAKRSAMASTCQSNMNQIGKAIKMYLSDWEDTYPTNRTVTGAITYQVVLVPAADLDTVGPFKYGVNWVEAMYKYMESITEYEDSSSAWRCPAASAMTWPNSPAMEDFVGTTYVFNYNLVEEPEGTIKGSGNLMMVRELDRLVPAHCRPINRSTGDGSATGIPRSPFLTTQDYAMGSTELTPKLHGNGSHVLFCDGHVKQFDTRFYPSSFTVSKNWDPETSQWYNYVFPDPADEWEEVADRSIAITP